MEEILEGLPGVKCQTDDILVFGNTREQHDRHLRAVLKRLQDANVTLNSKCQFSKTEIGFLGQIISPEGVRADPAKTQAIRDMKAPEDISGVRRGAASQFLGRIGKLVR